MVWVNVQEIIEQATRLMWHPPEDADGLVGGSVEVPAGAKAAVKVSVIGTGIFPKDRPKTRL